jgi:hypothetical protein
MRNLLFASLVAIGAFGCGSSTTKSPGTASAPPPAEHQAGQCPMKEMAGVKATPIDTSDGVAIEFTTTGDVAALREHVRKMADMHNAKTMHHGDMGSGMHEGMGSGMHEGMGMAPSRAAEEDLPNGAKIVIVPDDPSQLAALRSHVREHAAMMAKGECPMMGNQPHQAPPT